MSSFQAPSATVSRSRPRPEWARGLSGRCAHARPGAGRGLANILPVSSSSKSRPGPGRPAVRMCGAGSRRGSPGGLAAPGPGPTGPLLWSPPQAAPTQTPTFPRASARACLQSWSAAAGDLSESGAVSKMSQTAMSETYGTRPLLGRGAGCKEQRARVRALEGLSERCS